MGIVRKLEERLGFGAMADDCVSSPPIKCTESGGFLPHDDCSCYYQCTENLVPIPLKCGTNLYFNPLIGYCDYPGNVPECVGGTRPTTSDDSEDSSNTVTVVLIGGLATGIVILLVLLIVSSFVISKRRAMPSTCNQLTKDEIREFREGILNGYNNSTTAGSTRRSSFESSNHVPILSKPYNNKQYEIPRSNLKVDETSILGSGMYGMVLKGFVANPQDGDYQQQVAIKTVKKDANALHLKSLLSELKILSNLSKHPNIVNLIGGVTRNLAKGEFYVVVEFCCNGNFRDYLIARRDTFVNMVDADIIRYAGSQSGPGHCLR